MGPIECARLRRPPRGCSQRIDTYAWQATASTLGASVTVRVVASSSLSDDPSEIFIVFLHATSFGTACPPIQPTQVVRTYASMLSGFMTSSTQHSFHGCAPRSRPLSLPSRDFYPPTVCPTCMLYFVSIHVHSSELRSARFRDERWASGSASR